MTKTGKQQGPSLTELVSRAIDALIDANEDPVPEPAQRRGAGR